MRPRHKAAENADSGGATRFGITASMRPRHKAAENQDTSYPTNHPLTRFNEAAA